MSGLVQFFSKFLNNNKNDDNNDDNSDRGEDHHNEKEQYKRSLADLSQPIGDEDGGVDDGEQPEYTDYAFDYKMWKTRRNEILEAFAEKRFSTPLHENDDDDKQEEEEETQDLDETQQSQGLDTQEQETSNALETQEEGQGLPQKHSRQRKPGRKVIPHCRYETLHNVHFMEDIDLYTRTANLNLCLVTKVFDYRECERYAATSAYIPRYLPIIETSNGAMLNVRNLPITEDGPLSTVYDHCLSIEVQQLIHRPDKQALATTAANWIPTSSRKMRIFFYDDYAAAIRDTLLNLDARNQMVLLRAQDINAASIIPYAVGHWFDYQELYEECICIGATSKMMVNLGDGPKKFQFVTSNLRLQIAIGNKETGDFQVGFDITNGPDDTERVNVEEYTPPEDTLFEKFRSWKKSWQEVNDDDKEPTDIVGSPDEEMENVDPEDRQHQHRQQQQQQRPDKPQEQQTQQLGTPNQQHRATASDKQTSQLCDEEDKEQSADHSNRKKRDPQSPSQGLRHQKRAKSSTKYTRLVGFRPLLF